MSLCAAVFMQNNPLWIGQHPHWVQALYAVGLVLVTLAAVQFKPVQRLIGICGPDGEQTGMSNAGAYAGKNNTGNQISHSTLNIGGAFPWPAPEQKTEAIEATSNLVALAVKHETDAGQFAAGRPISLLPIENRIPEGNLRTLAAEGVCASIRFKRDTKEITLIKRAYWTNSAYSRQSIGIHDIKHLVLGSFDGSKRWIAYDNPGVERSMWFDDPEMRKPARQAGMEIGWQPGITAEVSVFDETTGVVYMKVVYNIWLEKIDHGMGVSLCIKEVR